jgi:hypothetical protein
VGGGLGSPPAGFPPSKEIVFFDDFSILIQYDFWPFLLLIFFPLKTADFLMLLKPPGDGYSLLCSKNSLCGTISGTHGYADPDVHQNVMDQDIFGAAKNNCIIFLLRDLKRLKTLKS